MINICKLGNLKEKGYTGSFDFLHPVISKSSVRYISSPTVTKRIIEFNTKIELTSNQNYVNIEIVLLGFGLRFTLFEGRV